jgi:hypothetical protein
MPTQTWPLVDANDDGIRPAGKPDECFYCHQKVGQPHGPECVVVHKKVRVRVTMEIEMEVPASWDDDAIEFHYNDGTWCANNIVGLIQDYLDSHDEDICVLCPTFSAEVVADVPGEPYAKLRFHPNAKGSG